MNDLAPIAYNDAGEVVQENNPALEVAWNTTGLDFWKQRIDSVKSEVIDKKVSTALSKSGYEENTNRLKMFNRVVEVEDPNINLIRRVSQQKIKDKPNALPATSPYVVLQEWEGVVDSIRANHFVALLADITANKTHLTLKAKIEMQELHPIQAQKLQVGAIFRWLIGYRNESDGRQRFSEIVFRDRPRISKHDRVVAKAAVRKLFANMKPLE